MRAKSDSSCIDEDPLHSTDRATSLSPTAEQSEPAISSTQSDDDVISISSTVFDSINGDSSDLKGKESSSHPCDDDPGSAPVCVSFAAQVSPIPHTHVLMGNVPPTLLKVTPSQPSKAKENQTPAGVSSSSSTKPASSKKRKADDDEITPPSKAKKSRSKEDPDNGTSHTRKTKRRRLTRRDMHTLFQEERVEREQRDERMLQMMENSQRAWEENQRVQHETQNRFLNLFEKFLSQ